MKHTVRRLLAAMVAFAMLVGFVPNLQVTAVNPDDYTRVLVYSMSTDTAVQSLAVGHGDVGNISGIIPVLMQAGGPTWEIVQGPDGRAMRFSNRPYDWHTVDFRTSIVDADPTANRYILTVTGVATAGGEVRVGGSGNPWGGLFSTTAAADGSFTLRGILSAETMAATDNPGQFSGGFRIQPMDTNTFTIHNIVLERITGQAAPVAPPPPPPPPEPVAPVAQDDPSSWALPYVNEAIALNLVPSALRSAYNFAITRAEFTALAVNTYESILGTITGRETFNDTSDVNVEKMAYLGVVGGVGGGRFNPDGTLTREQAAAIMSRLADAMDQPLPAFAPTFADMDRASDWAVDNIGQMEDSGIMGGVGSNRFDPRGTYTREQSIITVVRLHRIVSAAIAAQPEEPAPEEPELPQVEEPDPGLDDADDDEDEPVVDEDEEDEDEDEEEEPAAAVGDDAIVWQMSADPVIQGFAVGFASGDMFEDVAQLARSGSPMYTIVEGPNGNGVRVTNRAAGYYAIDLLLPSLGLDIANNTYTLTIIGNGTGEWMFFQADNPWADIQVENVSGDFTAELQLTSAVLNLPGIAYRGNLRLGMRGDVDFTVFDIIVTRN